MAACTAEMGRVRLHFYTRVWVWCHAREFSAATLREFKVFGAITRCPTKEEQPVQRVIPKYAGIFLPVGGGGGGAVDLDSPVEKLPP